MGRFVILFAAILTLLAPARALADAGDINAAARGVVRVLIVSGDGERTFPVSHGTGFAVSPDRIVTNNHVIDEVAEDDRLRILIVPPEGGEAVPARIVSRSPRNDLALLQIRGGLRLPPLTLSGSSDIDSGDAYSVGYPQNVDIAQGLQMGDVFRPQPPVKARGFLAGRRPSRRFDTILHTAPIARGNSGGPLLDDCGRVVGTNSFGAQSGGADAEFFFAVSNRELLPFLRGHDVTPRVNSMPCRSIAELDAAEQQRAAAALAASEAEARADAAEREEAEDRAARRAELALMDERDFYMALGLALFVLATGSGFVAWQLYDGGRRLPFRIVGAVCLLAGVGAAAAWITRPAFASLDDRVAAALVQLGEDDAAAEAALVSGDLVCTVDVARSRITGSKSDDLPLKWGENGCVNGRTQYGLDDGRWSRVFVPQSEATVSVNRFDPATGEYRIERYLLGARDLAAARVARGQYNAPSCDAGAESARELGEAQLAVIAALPDRPNERVVYTCRSLGGAE